MMKIKFVKSGAIVKVMRCEEGYVKVHVGDNGNKDKTAEYSTEIPKVRGTRGTIADVEILEYDASLLECLVDVNPLNIDNFKKVEIENKNLYLVYKRGVTGTTSDGGSYSDDTCIGVVDHSTMLQMKATDDKLREESGLRGGIYFRETCELNVLNVKYPMEWLEEDFVFGRKLGPIEIIWAHNNEDEDEFTKSLGLTKKK